MENTLLSQEAINSLEIRIQNEQFSSRLYEDMYLWFEDKGYSNLAKLYKKYSEEELTHANWSVNFLFSYNLKPCLKILKSPEAEYIDCGDILQATLEHETTISQECDMLMKEAFKRGEMSLFTLASKYVAEQVEELKKAYDLLNIYKLTTDMLVFDNYVGENYI